jgi:putative chitinase
MSLLTKPLALAAQAALDKAGYSPGAIDGDFRAKSLCALLAYAAGSKITPQILALAEPLYTEMMYRNITGIRRIAHFVATIVHETQGLTRFEENLSYTRPDRLDAMFSAVKGLEHAAALIKAGVVAIGNCIYANRLGNGDEASGDGYRYRGRSPFHLTGRENYRRMAAALNLPLEVDPDLALRPEVGARIACQFWVDKNLWKWADRDDAAGVRYRVNGEAMVGLDDCRRIAASITRLFA